LILRVFGNGEMDLGSKETEGRDELDWGTKRRAEEAIGGETLTHVEWSNG
jgi:hypothetical protein